MAACQRDVDLRCEPLDITDGNGWNESFWRSFDQADGRLELGWDVARHTDLSVLWVNRTPGDKMRRLAGLVIMRRTAFALQRTVIRSGLDRFRNAVGCGDATGLGMDSNETLATVYGSRWQPVTFTAKEKRSLASGMMTAFDEGSQALPADCGEGGSLKMIPADIYAIQRVGDKAVMTLEESENPIEPDSHCDIAWAGSLAIRAGGIAGTTAYLSVA